MVEFWQRTFDDLRMIFQTQTHSLQNAVAKLMEVPIKERKPAYQPAPTPVANETKPRWKETVRATAKPKNDVEELKQAMEEYEMAKGDWSKGR
jgi:hypothetical protein